MIDEAMIAEALGDHRAFGNKALTFLITDWFPPPSSPLPARWPPASRSTSPRSGRCRPPAQGSADPDEISDVSVIAVIRPFAAVVFADEVSGSEKGEVAAQELSFRAAESAVGAAASAFDVGAHGAPADPQRVALRAVPRARAAASRKR